VCGARQWECGAGHAFSINNFWVSPHPRLVPLAEVLRVLTFMGNHSRIPKEILLKRALMHFNQKFIINQREQCKYGFRHGGGKVRAHLIAMVPLSRTNNLFSI